MHTKYERKNKVVTKLRTFLSRIFLVSGQKCKTKQPSQISLRPFTFMSLSFICQHSKLATLYHFFFDQWESGVVHFTTDWMRNCTFSETSISNTNQLRPFKMFSYRLTFSSKPTCAHEDLKMILSRNRRNWKKNILGEWPSHLLFAPPFFFD